MKWKETRVAVSYDELIQTKLRLVNILVRVFFTGISIFSHVPELLWDFVVVQVWYSD